MPTRIVFVATLLALAFPACGANPTPVPISALLKDPDAYDGKEVRISGAAVVRFEAVFVCEFVDEIVGDSERCLWMAPDDIADGAVRLAPIHNRVVEITGRFRAKRHGHMGAYGGEVEVTKYAILGKHDRGDVPPVPPSPPGS
jgi:hypothetical protein